MHLFICKTAEVIQADWIVKHCVGLLVDIILIEVKGAQKYGRCADVGCIRLSKGSLKCRVSDKHPYELEALPNELHM